MKVYIDFDEWYPVYSIMDESPYRKATIEVDEATVERWKRVATEFEAVQTEMDEAYHARVSV